MLSLATSLCWQASQWDGGSTMDSFLGRRSMQTLRKLPIARPRRANSIIKTISTRVYCGRIIGWKSILHWYYCQAQLFLSSRDIFLLSLRVPIRRDEAIPFLRPDTEFPGWGKTLKPPISILITMPRHLRLRML
jgi:hypothetical protein